ncbi:hypothetical protein ACFQDN_08225 [Pseudomonas asuensis]|nr:hypothetical protein [Pseudomonas asuensis]
MHLSAEARWFWPVTPDAELIDWFHQRGPWAQPPGGGALKTHHYLKDATQSEMGIKTRDGSAVELKGLVAATWDILETAPFTGPVELWSKWYSETLTLRPHPTVPVKKQRWLRMFTVEQSVVREIALDESESAQEAMPCAGCTLELTQLWVNDRPAGWTLGLEAFGDIPALALQLKAVATHLSVHCPPKWPDATRNHYPGWLKHQVEN